MTARELFAVIVRTLGLLLVVIALVQIAAELADFLQPPPPMPRGVDLALIHSSFTRGLTQDAVVGGLGLVLLFGPRWIVRLVYGSQPLSRDSASGNGSRN